MCMSDRGSGSWVNLSKALSQGVRRLKRESIPENCLCVIPPRIHYSMCFVGGHKCTGMICREGAFGCTFLVGYR